MKKFISTILGVAAVLGVSSCEDFLTVEPIDEVSADTFLKNEQELKLFCNGMIETYRPSADDIAEGDLATDIIAKRDPSKFWFTNDIFKPSDQSAWSYTNVRRANLLIHNMSRAKGNISEELYNHYQGVGRFWRAYFMLGKVRTYGDCPWQDNVVSVNDTVALYAPKDDREYVMHKCIEDLQYAVENCLGDDNYKAQINKWVAAAVLSRAALYEGTYRKYHNLNYSTNEPWNNQYETADDLLKICCEASEVLMNSGKFSLNSSYKANFITENLLSNPEMIWVAEYSTNEECTVTHSLTSDYRGSTVGGPSPTKSYVNNFLKKDGTPITDDKMSLYVELAENNGRDPRLNDCVNHEGLTYSALSGETYKKWMPCNLTYTGYNLTKWNIEEEKQFQVAKCGNSIPILRYAEVLLNYAEAKAELGLMDDSIWASTVGAIRKRAGITGTGRTTSLDPILYKYYADAYEYEEGTGQDSRVAELKAHLTPDLLEIRRERVTELGHEGRRSDDLRRWHCLSIIPMRGTNGNGWYGIYVTKDDYKNGFLFNANYTAVTPGTGDYSFDAATGKYVYVGANHGDYTLWHGKVSFASKASETSFAVGTSGADQSYTLTDGDHGYLMFHYKLEWNSKKYLYPINSTSVMVYNTNITQNYGWR